MDMGFRIGYLVLDFELEIRDEKMKKGFWSSYFGVDSVIVILNF